MSPFLTARGNTNAPKGPRVTGFIFYDETVNRLYDVAAAAQFAPAVMIEKASARQLPSETEVGHQPTNPSSVADPEIIADATDAPELRALEELRIWLNVSYDDLAKILGLRSASLIHYWRRRHRDGKSVRPRAASVERLWRVYYAVRGMAETLEGPARSFAVQLWIRDERVGNSPLALLYSGDIEAFEGRARRFLFDQSVRQVDSAHYASLDADDEFESPISNGALPSFDEEDFG